MSGESPSISRIYDCPPRRSRSFCSYCCSRDSRNGLGWLPVLASLAWGQGPPHRGTFIYGNGGRGAAHLPTSLLPPCRLWTGFYPCWFLVIASFAECVEPGLFSLVFRCSHQCIVFFASFPFAEFPLVWLCHLLVLPVKVSHICLAQLAVLVECLEVVRFARAR